MSLFDKVGNFTYNSYFKQANTLSNSLQKLSTGLRRPTAADGAALNSMAKEMEQQVRGNETIRTYLQTYDSYASTQDDYLQSVGDIVDQMTELASASLAGSSSQRANLNKEYQGLVSEMKLVLDTSKFNGTRLFSAQSSFNVRLGMGASQYVGFDQIKLQSVVGALSAGVAAGVILTTAGASAALLALTAQVNAVNYMRVQVGGNAGIVQRTMQSLESLVSNLESASDTIMNVDLAKETSEYIKQTTLFDAASAALVQANGLQTSISTILNTLK